MLTKNYLFQKKKCFKYRISMIPNCHFSELQIQKVMVPMAGNFPTSVISTKLYFVEIGREHQKLQIFKCTMLETLNSDFLD